MDNTKKKPGTKVVATGGILMVLSIVLLYGATIVPGVELCFYCLTSLVSAIMVIEGGFSGGRIFYVGTSILGLIIIPDKTAVLPYILLFGLYANLKAYAEKSSSRPVQIIVKSILFVLMFGAVYKLCLGVLINSDSMLWSMPWFIIGAAGYVFFILYDTVLSMLIGWYYEKIHGKI